jgi:hypothetical protein
MRAINESVCKVKDITDACSLGEDTTIETTEKNTKSESIEKIVNTKIDVTYMYNNKLTSKAFIT